MSTVELTSAIENSVEQMEMGIAMKFPSPKASVALMFGLHKNRHGNKNTGPVVPVHTDPNPTKIPIKTNGQGISMIF